MRAQHLPQLFTYVQQVLRPAQELRLLADIQGQPQPGLPLFFIEREPALPRGKQALTAQQMQLPQRKALEMAQYLLRVRKISPCECVARILSTSPERCVILALGLAAVYAQYALRPAVESAQAVVMSEYIEMKAAYSFPPGRSLARQFSIALSRSSRASRW